MTDSNGLTNEQKQYLQGLAMGTDVARTVRGLPLIAHQLGPAVMAQIGTTRPVANGHGLNESPSAAAPTAAPLPLQLTAPQAPDSIWWHAQDSQATSGRNLVPEELAKRERHPLDRWDEVIGRSRDGKFPRGTDVFLTKYFGLFYVAPAQDAYMCRLRFAGGAVPAHQLAGLADLADRYAGGYADATTRANLQLREIPADAAAGLLEGLAELGIVSRGSGADNVRNITASPLSGLDPTETIETLPLARQMHHYLLNHREMTGLPRKFNIAFDGGGQVTSLEDTNDIGFRAIRVTHHQNSTNTPHDDVAFLVSLAGITGHQDFARPTDVVVDAGECIPTAAAILRVFLRHGDRTDRKRARLKYLIDEWGLEKFLLRVETERGAPFRRLGDDTPTVASKDLRHAHLGIHPQRQAGYVYIGMALDIGRVSSRQMRGLARLAQQYGQHELRLTVWQTLILPHIRVADLPIVLEQLTQLDLRWECSPVRAGIVACTGNAGCKFAAANTKEHARQLIDYVEERLELDQPLNIHLTGCSHSCAQHFIGDIGLLATSVANEHDDEMVEGYHLFVGGGYGNRQAIGRCVANSVPFASIPPRIVRLLEYYLQHRLDSAESFAEFARRVPTEALREATEARDAIHST